MDYKKVHGDPWNPKKFTKFQRKPGSLLTVSMQIIQSVLKLNLRLRTFKCGTCHSLIEPQRKARLKKCSSHFKRYAPNKWEIIGSVVHPLSEIQFNGIDGTSQQHPARIYSAKNDPSVAKKTNSGLYLQSEMVIILDGFEPPEYEKWSKLGTKVCSKPRRSAEAWKKFLTPECHKMSLESNKRQILKQQLFGSQKLHRLASRSQILVRFSSHIPSFPKFIFFKIVSFLNVIYTLGIGVTVILANTGRIHIELGAVITISITGLVGLSNACYNITFYLHSDQINWTMRQVKQLAFNLGSISRVNARTEFVSLAYGFFSLIFSYLMFAISPLFGLELDALYYFHPSLHCDHRILGMLLRVIVGLLQGYHWTFGTYILFMVVIEFVIMSANILTLLSIQKNVDISKYNSIRILVTSYNQIFSYMGTFVLGCSSVIYISSTYAMITSYNKTPLAVYSIFPLATVFLSYCWGVILNTAAKIYTSSGEYINKYKWSGTDRRRAAMMKRSLQRVGMICGSIGVVSEMSILKLYDVWMDQTASALLAWK
ncbi:hypothetical protein Fcan01_15681 [Folsomia candida]|uniref:Uncharacterized protein n=1 Tax=Folsomia candida TaxID=158441 RepID=A0A226DWZ4_FOLCA|nr:hypothetical protein Fcan01_15681 [Folsomia candida]